MTRNGKITLGIAALAASALVGIAASSGEARRDVRQKSSESSVATNENGTVSRTFTEMTVSTNGNLVTEHRRETRTTTDGAGNLLESTTSEYAQSYPVGDTGMASLTAPLPAGGKAKGAAAQPADSFMGLKFGEVFKGTNFVADADEPALLRTTFAPKRGLAGFDDYYVYVTPKTHRVAKVYACAKEAVDPGANWSRHYLIEALEKRYNTWARPRSWCRPVYSFDVGGGRFVTACLEDASPDYETVLAAWDDAMLAAGADEAEAIREAARKDAAARRSRRVSDAADAF